MMGRIMATATSRGVMAACGPPRGCASRAAAAAALFAPNWPAAPPRQHRAPYLCGPGSSSSSSSSSISVQQRQQHQHQQRRAVVVLAAGVPFVLTRPRRQLRFKWGRQQQRPVYTAGELRVEVDALSEGRPASVPRREVERLLEQLEADAAAAVPLALEAKQRARPKYRLPAIANVSLVLCDDEHIRRLNRESRGKDAATDVLSFEMPDEPGMEHVPVKLLGDLVISLDTAQRQADERGHSLLAELRILLVHGLLHLAGFDHERGEAESREMAECEAEVLDELGWEGAGLISAAEAASGSGNSSSQGEEDAFSRGNEPSISISSSSSSSSSSGGGGGGGGGGSEASTSGGSGVSSATATIAQSGRRRRKRDVQLIALDMDGTLLDSSSSIRPDSAEAIKAALSGGVRVVLATGKARPAAIAACRRAGLEGDALLVSQRTPGVFLQGLAVHGSQGQQLLDASLPREVVARAFEWAAAADVSCVAFLGDECATLKLTRELEELHTTYYEPLAQECSSLDELLSRPSVRKLLFMADAGRIEGTVKPHWSAALELHDAEVLQAVPNMLEVVPAGVNKWAGLQVLLDHMQVPPHQLMAVGDGSNDLQMVGNAGLGVAMGNAVQAVKDAAAQVVSSNDEGGIAEAFERFVL